MININRILVMKESMDTLMVDIKVPTQATLLCAGLLREGPSFGLTKARQLLVSAFILYHHLAHTKIKTQ